MARSGKHGGAAMAKAQEGNHTVIVYADAFGERPPRMSEVRARALAQVGMFEPTEAEQLSCTDWQDEPTQPSGKGPDCAICGTPKSFHQVFTNTNDKTAWCRGGKYEGHSYSPAQPASEATLPTCSGNGSFSAGDVFDVGASKDAVIALYFPNPGEPAPSHGDVVGPRQWHIVMDGGHCGNADCNRCDSLDRMVDGLTAREALARYEVRMREGIRNYDDDHWDTKRDPALLPSMGDVWKRESRFPRGFRLNDAQLAAAHSAWSAQLRAKQQEAREKERAQVVCERD